MNRSVVFSVIPFVLSICIAANAQPPGGMAAPDVDFTNLELKPDHLAVFNLPMGGGGVSVDFNGKMKTQSKETMENVIAETKVWIQKWDSGKNEFVTWGNKKSEVDTIAPLANDIQNPGGTKVLNEVEQYRVVVKTCVWFENPMEPGAKDMTRGYSCSQNFMHFFTVTN